MKLHKDLTTERWHAFSLMEQLANAGADIDRAIFWKKEGDLELSDQAFYRALELLDFTKADSKNRGPLLKELCRVREALIDHFVYGNEYQTTEQSWHDYFFDFNYAAALEKGR